MVAPGYAGRILHVDLGTGATKVKPLDRVLIETFLGGYGINSRLAWDQIPPYADSLSPQNAIILGAGPFAGTMIPGAAKLLITTKFPVNGAFATAAAGGSFPLWLKTLGYDHVVITGRALRPVYLRLAPDQVELGDASALWGKDIFETVDALRLKYEPCSVLPIGPAGEHLARVSVTSLDKGGTAGSGGLPAVMGSKNLKAIVAQMGTTPVTMAHRLNLIKLVDNLHQRMMVWPGRTTIVQNGMRPEPDEPLDVEHALDNYERAHPKMDRAEWQRLVEMHRETRKVLACPTCPLADKEMVTLAEGPYAGLTTYMTHYLTHRFSSQTAADEYIKGLQFADATNRYGLCAFEYYYAFSFMTHLYRLGIISKEDTGMELKEDFETCLKLARMTAYREGFGDVIADGTLEAAQRLGRDARDRAVLVKGRSISWDPRMFSLGTMEFEQLTRPRGSHMAAGGSPTYAPGRSLKDIRRHLQRMGAHPDAIDRVVGTSSFNVGRLTRYSEDWFSLFNCLSLCLRAFVNRFYHVDSIAQLYTAVTGIETTSAKLMAAAERAWTMDKLLNTRIGFSRKDDRPPEKWFQPLKTEDGDRMMRDYFNTKDITREDMERFLDDYYHERGYDKATGTPGPDRVRELGLD